MDAKCIIFMNCSRTFIGICKKKSFPTKEYLRDHRCEGTVSKVTGINKEKEICLSDKEYLSDPEIRRNKNDCQIHSTCAYYS